MLSVNPIKMGTANFNRKTVVDIHILKIKMKRVSQCIHFEEIYTLETVTVAGLFLLS